MNAPLRVTTPLRPDPAGYFDFDLRATGTYDAAPDEKSVGYGGWTEVRTLEINGQRCTTFEQVCKVIEGMLR